VGLEEHAVVGHGRHDLLHVVAAGGAVGDDLVELGAVAVRCVRARDNRGQLVAVVGQVAQQGLDLRDAVRVALGDEVAHAALGGVGHGAAQLVVGDLLADDGLDDVGARDVHVARALDHEDPVRQSRRVDGASRRGAHDGRDLGDVARADRVAVEDPAVALQGGHALLDAGAAGVVERDEGLLGVLGHVHDLPDLAGVHLAEAAAGAREVLGGGEDGAPVDVAEAADDGVGVDLLVGEPEQGGSLLDEELHFLERARVIELQQALAGRHLARFVLLLDGGLSALFHELLAFRFECLDSVFRQSHVSVSPCLWCGRKSDISISFEPAA